MQKIYRDSTGKEVAFKKKKECIFLIVLHINIRIFSEAIYFWYKKINITLMSYRISFSFSLFFLWYIKFFIFKPFIIWFNFYSILFAVCILNFVSCWSSFLYICIYVRIRVIYYYLLFINDHYTITLIMCIYVRGSNIKTGYCWVVSELGWQLYSFIFLHY